MLEEGTLPEGTRARAHAKQEVTMSSSAALQPKGYGAT